LSLYSRLMCSGLCIGSTVSTQAYREKNAMPIKDVRSYILAASSISTRSDLKYSQTVATEAATSVVTRPVELSKKPSVEDLDEGLQSCSLGSWVANSLAAVVALA